MRRKAGADAECAPFKYEDALIWLNELQGEIEHMFDGVPSLQRSSAASGSTHLRRKAKFDVATHAPDDLEEALFWLSQLRKQVAHAEGDGAAAIRVFDRDERLAVIGAAMDIDQRSPVPVLSIVKAVASSAVMGAGVYIAGAVEQILMLAA